MEWDIWVGVPRDWKNPPVPTLRTSFRRDTSVSSLNTSVLLGCSLLLLRIGWVNPVKFQHTLRRGLVY